MIIDMGRKKTEDIQIASPKVTEPVSIESQEKLVRIMNDTPTVAKFNGTVWEIHGLRPAVQWKIAEEAVNIVKKENATMGDVIKQFAVSLPSVVKVITYALLNDKERIENEFDATYNAIMWGTSTSKDWAILLTEIIGMIDVSFFFQVTDAIQTIRTMLLDRKTTMEEQKLLLQGQLGGK